MQEIPDRNPRLFIKKPVAFILLIQNLEKYI